MESNYQIFAESLERFNVAMREAMPYIFAGLVLQHLAILWESEQRHQEDLGLITSVQGNKMFFGSQGISIIAERPKFK